MFSALRVLKEVAETQLSVIHRGCRQLHYKQTKK